MWLCDKIVIMLRIVSFLGMFFMGNLCASQVENIVRATNSFLTAQSFPNTFQDLSFEKRVQVIQEGFEPWESEYDSSGNCISGCAYSGITIEDEMAGLNRQTQYANQNLNQVMQQAKIQQQLSQQNNFVVSDTTGFYRAPSVPVGLPVAGNPRISSPFGVRVHPVTGNKQVHKGIDLAVHSGTDVFAPAGGIVTDVWTDKTCGKGVKIRHDMGYETVYCHLSALMVKENDIVNTGYVIAKSGNTGRTTGAHLHYAIKYNGEYINPADFIGG